MPEVQRSTPSQSPAGFPDVRLWSHAVDAGEPLTGPERGGTAAVPWTPNHTGDDSRPLTPLG